jgi:signal peptidase
VAVSEDGAEFTTRGDANNVADKLPVPAADVKARYLFAIPELGNLLRRMHSREGFIAVVLVPGSLIILVELVSIVRTLRRKDELPAT